MAWTAPVVVRTNATAVAAGWTVRTTSPVASACGPRIAKGSRSSIALDCIGPTPPELFLDRRLLDVIELREILDEVGVAFRRDLSLRRTTAARRAFAVTAVQRIDDVHARHDFSERRERATRTAGAG